ncbi:MAG: ArsB/NhaD family transporter [Thaumarchaeota archaeon]|nr:ArsB/NhaD family transporter [Nitrososphaerota archaeon]
MQQTMIIGGIVLVVIIAMLFTLPDMIGLEFTIAMSLTLSVLMGIYVILVTEAIHRTSLVMIGALFIIIILIYTGLIPAHDTVDFVIGAIDFNTIGLLLGMMIIVGILGETGVFQYIGIQAAKLSKGNVWKLMVLLSVITAVGSAFLDNVTMVLLIVPVTISVARVLNINPIPLILAEIFASNVGGASTLIGDPPNIMIASAANIDFISFAYHMTPEVIITFAASFLILRIMFRKDLKQKPEHIEKLMQIDAKKEIKDVALLKKSVIVLLGVVIAFMFHGFLDLEVSIIALAGAAILLVITRLNPAKAFTHVEWPTLIFFAGLFIIVSGVELTGALELFAHEIVNVTGGNFEATSVLIIWSAAFASAFVDNIPYTATMIPIIENISLDPIIASSLANFSFNPLWYALAIGADFGGNGTLIGASANLVAIAVAERHGYRMFFKDFIIKGMPYMIATVAIGTGVFLVRLMLNV